jgi:ribosomal protein L30
MLPSTSRLSAPTHHLITLLRAPIGLPPVASRTLESLGLYRRHQSVLHRFDPTVAGKILRVKELVGVKNVSEEEGERAIWMSTRGRKEGSGVEVSGRVYGGGKGAEA